MGHSKNKSIYRTTCRKCGRQVLATEDDIAFVYRSIHGQMIRCRVIACECGGIIPAKYFRNGYGKQLYIPRSEINKKSK